MEGLTERHLKIPEVLASIYARDYRTLRRLREEIQSVAALALVEGLKEWDPERFPRVKDALGKYLYMRCKWGIGRWLKSRKYRKRSFNDELVSLSGIEDIPPTPFRFTMEDRDLISYLTKTCTPHQREVLRLWSIGYSSSEMGRMYKCRKQAVNHCLHRALEKCRERLRELRARSERE